MDILGFTISDWLLLVAGILFAFYWFYTYNFDVLKKLGIPHSKPKPFLGNVLDFFNDGLEFEIQATKKYGKLFGYFECRRPVICTTDPDILRSILIKEFHNFSDRRSMYFRGYLKHGVFDEAGDHWRGMRNLLTPAFSSGKLKNMLRPMQNSVDHLVEQMKSIIATKGGQFESKESAGLFTMDVIGSAVFGIDLDCRSDPQNMFAVMGRRYFDLDITGWKIALLVYFDYLCPLIDKIFKLNMFDQGAEDYFAEMVRQAIKAKKDTGVKSKDFLGIIMDAEKDPGAMDEEVKTELEKIPGSKLSSLTEEEVIGNALLFFAAGFETTATTLGFLMYHLAVNQDAQDRLREEVIQVLGDKPSSNETLMKLTYMEQCINETLRLCPPVIRLDREAKQDIKIGEVSYPKGVLALIPIYALHRLPNIWPDPDVWNPDRFSPEEKAKRDPMYFLPFGLGPRQCIGMRLALQELKMAAADLVRNFRFHTTDETPIPLKLKKLSALSVSEKPLKLKVELLSP